MSFVDRIADANDIAEVFELVNEFISAMQYAGVRSATGTEQRCCSALRLTQGLCGLSVDDLIG